MIRKIKIYIIAGEASGDLHGGNLVKELRVKYPNLEVRGWGGDCLSSAGVQIDIRYEKTNFMGFTEVIKNLPFIFKLFRFTKNIILDFKPDFILLIDYPGFNLRMAKWAFKHSIPVYYYIAPQVWAWKETRIQTIKKYISKLFIILPFEKPYFEKHGITAYYFGHPLLEIKKNFKNNKDFRLNNHLSNQSIIALLPGSRKQEIKTMLPIYLESTKNECKYQIVIAGLKQHQSIYEDIILQTKMKVPIVYDDTYNLLHHSKFAIVTSGTATLETALFGVPEIIAYKGNQISYWIAKRLIKVKFIGLVNLIADKKIVQELIQHDCNPDAIQLELLNLKKSVTRKRIKYNYQLIQTILDGHNCYEKVASEILINHY